LKLRWTRPALNDLIEAQTCVAQDNPRPRKPWRNGFGPLRKV